MFFLFVTLPQIDVEFPIIDIFPRGTLDLLYTMVQQTKMAYLCLQDGPNKGQLIV